MGGTCACKWLQTKSPPKHLHTPTQHNTTQHTPHSEELRRTETAAQAEALQRALSAEDELRMRTYKAITHLMGPLALAQLLVACFPCKWRDWGTCDLTWLHVI